MLIGRTEEIAILTDALNSDESEMVSIIGRRRVGKTHLIRSVYKKEIVFQITGVQNASRQEQLDNFAFHLETIADSAVPIPAPRTWLAAFRMLIRFLEKKKTTEKRVLFFDELPWLATHRSGFLKALSFFWNSWAVTNNVVVVICGSAASWMIQKVVHDKGGLHNRITKRITLAPFSLHETELFLQKKQLRYNRYQIAQIYMTMGGVPHYLKELQKGLSAVQNIEKICFQKTGLLNNEFELLYPALFEHSDNHIAVVRTLASKWSGLHRAEILALTKLKDGGRFTKILEELETSGFISRYYPFGKKKSNFIYRLTDEYSLFYLKFIENNRNEGKDNFKAFQQTQSYKAWTGYAFESLCLKHIPQIKKALEIGGIYSLSSSFYKKGEESMDGCQIDLLIDRNDQVINVCELKFYAETFVLTKSYAEELRKKIALFRHYSKTKKQIFLTFITTFGIAENLHSSGLVDKALDLDALFWEA